MVLVALHFYSRIFAVCYRLKFSLQGQIFHLQRQEGELLTSVGNFQKQKSGRGRGITAEFDNDTAPNQMANGSPKNKFGRKIKEMIEKRKAKKVRSKMERINTINVKFGI